MKQRKGKIQGVHDDEPRKAKTENKQKKKNQEAIIREEMNSIREEQSVKPPALRPIKKTTQAQIF